MKILYIGLDARNYALRTCNELALRGHEIFAFVFKEDFFDKKRKIELENNITIEEIDDLKQIFDRCFLLSALLSF